MIEDAKFIKILVIGPEQSGKSQALLTYIESRVQPSKTVGVEFYTKYYTTTKKSEKFKLQIWDCSGNSTYKSIIKAHFKRADAIVLFSDPTRTQRSDLDGWMKLIKENSTQVLPKLFFVKNRHSDEDPDNQDIQKFAQQHRLQPLEINAKDKQSVDHAFNLIADSLESPNENPSFTGSTQIVQSQKIINQNPYIPQKQKQYKQPQSYFTAKIIGAIGILLIGIIIWRRYR